MKILTRFDYLLILIIFILSISIYFITTKALREDVTNGNVVIYYKNDVFKLLPLNEDTVYTVTTDLGSNIIEIKNKEVDMIDADCKDKLCVHEHKISYSNENIVCLPNKIVLKIENNKQSELDGMVR